jgi:hypothetical protein
MTVVPRVNSRPRRGASFPGAGVHGEPADLLSPHFHFAGVHANPGREPDTSQVVTESAGAADRATRPVEGGQEAIAGGVDLASTEPCQVPAHDRVVLVEERAPAGVTECGGSRGGIHDVGEENGGELSVRIWRGSSSGEELLDLAHDLIGVLVNQR